MKKLIKKSSSIVLIAAILFSVFLTVGCNGNSEKTETQTTIDTMTAPVVAEPPAVMPSDSTIDTTITKRPTTIKSKN